MCSKCSSAIWGSPVAAGLLNSGMCTIALGESRVAAELDAEVPYFRYHPLRHLGASILDHCGRQPEGVQKQQGWFPVDWPENAVIPDGSNDRDKLPDNVQDIVDRNNIHDIVDSKLRSRAVVIRSG
jgi:hypothetical protein